MAHTKGHGARNVTDRGPVARYMMIGRTLKHISQCLISNGVIAAVSGARYIWIDLRESEIRGTTI